MTTVTVGTTSSYTLTGADSIAFTLVQGTQAQATVKSAAGVLRYSSSFTESRNIGPFATGDVLTVTAMRGSIDYVTLFGDATTLGGAYMLKASDDGQRFSCAVALTISIPDGLSPRPSITVTPPASGNLTITMLGSEQVNAASSATRARGTTNPAGVALTGYKDVAAYGLSGA